MRYLVPAFVMMTAIAHADVWEPMRQAANQIAAAAKSDNRQVLRTFARHKQVWFFAHELCNRGEHDAALALAKADPHPPIAKLAAYVELRRKKPSDDALTKIFDAVVRDLRGGNVQVAVDTVAELEMKGQSVLESYLRIFQGKGLRALGRLDESADVLFDMSVAAESYGFVGAAMDGFYESGVSRYRQRDVHGAIVCWKRLLAIEETCRPPDMQAATNGNIAEAYDKAGEPLEALPYHEQALKLFRATRSPHLAKALSNVAVSYATTGAYTRALRCLEQSMRLTGRGAPRELVATRLSQVGAIHNMLGDYRQALEYFERALKLYQQEGSALDVASQEGQIGTALVQMGRYDAAVVHLERARKIFAEAKHPQLPFVISALGRVALERRDFDKSLALHREAYAIAQQHDHARLRVGMASTLGIALYYSKKHDEGIALLEKTVGEAQDLGLLDIVVNCQWALATNHLAAGHPKVAMRWIRDSIGKVGDRFRRIGQAQGTTARERYALIFLHGAMAAHQLDDAQAASFFVESSRAVTLLQSLGGRDRLQARTVPEALRDAEREARRKATIAEQRLAKAKAAKILKEARARRKENEAAQNELARVLARIETEVADAAEILYPRVTSVERIQSWLAKDEALVSYMLLEGEEALAMVITADGARVVLLGEADPIRAACDEIVLDDAETDADEQIAALHKMAWAPLGLTAKTKRVLVSPSGELSRVPFAVLAPKLDVAYVPSATTYGLLRDQARKKKGGTKILALGDPKYAGKLAPLPHTRKEAESIGDVVLLGDKATKAALIEALGSQEHWRAVHLACHGLVDMKRPMLSSLALSGGRLTAFETLKLKMSADLIVLSACETGKGKIALAEGVLGLTRTFMYAGGARVIVSLWQVEDEATQALMNRFYELWKKGSPAATALRKAQEHVRGNERWEHPRYWAAWQLWGLAD